MMVFDYSLFTFYCIFFISYAICSKYVAIAVQRVRKTTSLQFSLHNFSKLDSFIILSSTILIIHFTLGL